MSVKVGINGFGRIGRSFLKASIDNENFEIVAVNDLTSPETIAHLFKYDSVAGNFNGTVEVKGNTLIVNGKTITVTSERDPSNIPWDDFGVQIVVESTGFFTKKEDASKHLSSSVKKVIISAPAKGEDKTIVMGVNDDEYDPANHHIVSNASCTTNCLAPIVKILDEKWGITHGYMTTIHSYTNDQCTLDQPHSDLRRARAAALSMIPTSTGAAKAVSLVLPQVAGKLDGCAIRVPTPNVSLVDLVAELDNETTTEEVNAAFKEASQGSMKGYLAYSDEPLVSIDYNGNPASSTVDSLTTKVVDKKLVTVLSWYDNETGYSTRVGDLIELMIEKGI